MLRTVDVRFAGPGESVREAWETVTAELAGKAGITDLNRFRMVLVRGLNDTKDYAAGGGMARADGQTLPVTGDAVAAHSRIACLVEQLDSELEKAAWPLDGAEADDVRRALAVYRRRLCAVAWGTKSTRTAKKPGKPETCLVLVLAHYWQLLTGSTPDAWRPHGQTVGRGHFYKFIVLVCECFGLDAPKADTVRKALRHGGYL